MNKLDFNEFGNAWMIAHELSSSNKEQSTSVIKTAFILLQDHPLHKVLSAINAFTKKSRFAPTPADIISLLETKNKRLSADEAWAICPLTEFETVVWTGEIAEAYSICLDTLMDGDKIGARMAFKAAYERLVNIAELQNIPVAWRVAIGFDKKMIEPVVKKAVAAGRLTHEQAIHYLPPPQEAGPIAGMLTGKVSDINSRLPLKNARRMKSILANASKLAQEKENQKAMEIEKKAESREEKRIEAGEIYNKEIANNKTIGYLHDD